MVPQREQYRQPTKTRPGGHRSSPSPPLHLEAGKWISISGGLISLIMVHSPLSGPGVNIRGRCQGMNTDQSQGDGSWWPSNLPKLWWLLCWYHHSKFYHCHSLFLSRSTQTMCWHILLHLSLCLFQLAVTEKLSDVMRLCLRYCRLTNTMLLLENAKRRKNDKQEYVLVDRYHFLIYKWSLNWLCHF